MKVISGVELTGLKAAARSLAASTDLEVRWGRNRVRLEGLNRRRLRDVKIFVDVLEDKVETGEVVINNRRHALLFGEHAETRRIVLEGFSTYWGGGVALPWITDPVRIRVEQAIGARVVPKTTWVALRWLAGWNGRKPVPMLAGDDGYPLILNDDFLKEELEAGVTIWDLPPSDIADLVPMWIGPGFLGPLFMGPESWIPIRSVGARLPWGPEVACAIAAPGRYGLVLPDHGIEEVVIEDPSLVAVELKVR